MCVRNTTEYTTRRSHFSIHYLFLNKWYRVLYVAKVFLNCLFFYLRVYVQHYCTVSMYRYVFEQNTMVNQTCSNASSEYDETSAKKEATVNKPLSILALVSLSAHCQQNILLQNICIPPIKHLLAYQSSVEQRCCFGKSLRCGFDQCCFSGRGYRDCNGNFGSRNASSEIFHYLLCSADRSMKVIREVADPGCDCFLH